MIKAVIYARFSPRKNSENCESIETQIELCRDYCKKNGYEVIDEKFDRALSGGEIERPELWAAIELLRPGYALIVYRLDRLARSIYLSFIIEQTVKKRKASIVSINGEGTGGDSHEDELVRRILQALAEYERKVIAARTRSAMIRHQANGRRMSKITPYGWQDDPNDPARMIPDDTERECLELIKRYYSEGYSTRSIAQLLRDSKYKPRSFVRVIKGKKVAVQGAWQHLSVWKILSKMIRDGKIEKKPRYRSKK